MREQKFALKLLVSEEILTKNYRPRGYLFLEHPVHGRRLRVSSGRWAEGNAGCLLLSVLYLFRLVVNCLPYLCTGLHAACLATWR